jgi:hypothetical protein
MQKIEVVFYRTAAGNEVVRDWLQSLEKAERQAIGTDLKTLQYGWPIGMPLCRSLESGIWEIRSTLEPVAEWAPNLSMSACPRAAGLIPSGDVTHDGVGDGEFLSRAGSAAAVPASG